MENLTRESILQAIHKIEENPKLRNGRESSTYDLVYEGKTYPPILVLSEANKIIGGEELFLSDFGNDTKKAFRYLKELEFNVAAKMKENVNIWFVCQGSTYNDERGKKYLWAPKFDKDGKRRFHWENMNRVKKGDIVFHYSKGVRGVSVALTDCYSSKNADQQSVWGKDGYRVDINHSEFDKVISIEELKRKKPEIDSALKHIINKPFNVKGGVNQGYLFEFTNEAGKIILEIYRKKVGNEIIDNYFDKIRFPKNSNIDNEIQDNFDYIELSNIVKVSGLNFTDQLFMRFVSSLLTKPFLILTGLSGSGKTKLAQAFSRWICANKDQYCIIPVGADWTNREPLLGYPNALSTKEYVKPDNGALDLLIRANEKVNSNKPFFLILDEMNLSHVERYFADFLSVMESNEEINLYSGSARKSSDESIIPQNIGLAKNIFIIGTVNIDETTYMFSPKVLDRANVIEFRVSSSEIDDFLKNPKPVDFEQLDSKGSNMSQSFLELASIQNFANEDIKVINETLVGFFNELKKLGAEFGYRSANEIVRLINQLGVIETQMDIDSKIDIAIMQKLLPKLHGSRRKLCPVLLKLGEFCFEDKIEKIETEIFGKEESIITNYKVKYPISLEKIIRMYKGAVENGFASYAEA